MAVDGSNLNYSVRKINGKKQGFYLELSTKACSVDIVDSGMLEVVGKDKNEENHCTCHNYWLKSVV